MLPEASCTPGNRFSTIQSALNSATSPGADRVLIPAGTFAVPSGGLTYFGDQVEVVGAGQGATVLNGPATSSAETALNINHSGGGRSVVRGLTVNLGAIDPAAPAPNVGIRARGGVDLRDLLVRSDGRAFGVDLDSAATLTSSRVALPLELGTGTLGVLAGTGTSGATVVSDSAIEANQAVANGGGTEVQLARTAIKASICGVCGGRGPVFANDVLAEMADFSASGAWAFGARGDSVSGSSYVEVRNSTAVGGNSGTIGVLAQSGNGTPASAVVLNSIIRTPGVSLKREFEVSSGASADITANQNAFHPAAHVEDVSGHGSTVNIGPRTDDPRFLGGSGPGQYRLRHDSPLIDAGNSAPTPTVDFNGDPRVVDGNGDGSAVRDLGAFEYQRKPPAVTAAAAPASAFPGDPIAWTASGTDPDGDPLTYAWSWDDGATGSGASVSHAFTPLGAHTGTVTATDATGLTATAGASATVDAAPGGGGGGGGGGAPGDHLAPRFSLARRALTLSAKNVIAIRVTCDAAETEPCAGTLTLASAKRVGKGKRKRALTLGRAAFSVAPGRTAAVKVKVSKRTAVLARALRRFKVKATGVASDRAGNRATRSSTVTLVAPKVKKPR